MAVRGGLRRKEVFYGIGATALLLIGLLLLGPYQLPPPEALDEYPGWKQWKVFLVQVNDNDTAVVRLRHPDNTHVVAVLHYRLMYATVKEEP